MFFFFNFFDESEKLTANKGEWSELYAHIRLLADGKVFSGDEKYNRIANESFPIIKILRREKGNDIDTVYLVDSAKKQILVRGDKTEVLINQEQFDVIAKWLLEQIKAVLSKYQE